MRILILNQHTSNHGDEAAGKALIRGIRKSNIKESIGVLYNVGDLLEIEKFKVDEKVEHFSSGKASFVDKILLILTFVLPFGIVKKLFFLGTFTKYEYKLMCNYDKIINGPGGVNIGPYKDWKYIWRLYVALKLNKDVAIYSISFGPIPKTYLFSKISKYILTNVNFLSLRDNKSQAYADELSIKYIKSIDTAFLNNQPLTKMPEELSIDIGSEYVVVVPNQLNKWHPNFKDVNGDLFNEIYLKMINYFTDKNLKVILLPQLFGMQNDSEYFKILKKKANLENNVAIIDDKYSSDIQQKIISGAKFLVGARYHTIIFSINNKRPFLSLAYEHKMTNTLELIGLEDNNVLLKDIVEDRINLMDILENKFNMKDKTTKNVEEGSSEANKIAHQTLQLLVDKFLRIK